MLKTLGMVDACYDSATARSKAVRRMGGKTILDWVVRRATDCMQLDGVIVVTSSAAENAFVPERVPVDVPVFVGDSPEPLACFAQALERHGPRAAVRLPAGCPFVDPVLVDRLVATAEMYDESDYVSYCCRDGRPAILSPVGVYAEWFRTRALLTAARSAKAPLDRHHVTRYLYSHPEKFHVRLLPAPGKIDRDDVRLTVDMEEDWEHALAIYEALGPDELDWQRIADLLDHQPALRKRMEMLNRVQAMN